MTSRRNISTDAAAKTALKNELGVTNLEENQTVGYLAYSTYAELPTSGTLNYSYKVTNDSDISLNGFYHWTGSDYVKDAELYPVLPMFDKEFSAQSSYLEELTIIKLNTATDVAGYYNKSGSLIIQNGWYNIGLQPIGEAVYLKSFDLNLTNVATIVFFNSSSVYIGYRDAVSGETSRIFTEFPTGTAYFSFSYYSPNIEYYEVRSGSYISLIDKVNLIEDEITELNINKYNVIGDELPFSESGWYNTSGTLTIQSGFSNTGKIEIDEGVLLKAKRFGSTIADICFFDSGENFIEAYQLPVGDADFYIYTFDNIPEGSVYFAVNTYVTAVRSVVNGTLKRLLEEVIDLKDYSNVLEQKTFFNYVRNYKLLNEINSSNTVYGAYWQAGDIVRGNDFSDYGFDRFVEIVRTTSGNNALYQIDNSGLRSEIQTTKKIGIKFLMKSSVAGTIRLDIYNRAAVFTSFANVSNVFEANEIKEITLVGTIPDSYFLAPQWIQFFFISMPIGTFKIAGIHIFDSEVEPQKITNQLSLNDSYMAERLMIGGYYGKTFLPIGDSISASSAYAWKALLEESFGLIYNRIDEGATPPAVGGTPLYPPVAEVTDYESIWWRCGGARLSDYDFDFITLWGGTNDLLNAALAGQYGSRTDTPYLDTDLRPGTLTWASAFKGCIEMLQRDFPDKELVIITVMDTGYGLEDYDGTYTRKEKMARLQMQIAYDYSLKCVPVFWNSGITGENYDLYLWDAVHPTTIGAKRINATIAETLGLKNI